ncbi:hypothetical protein C8J57DRAFT_1461406 [Mycena rebaudengoi]|nr:hypothetical protein C8J57DRAFT_1461406 [Mycena rebaudengoi]
MTSSSSLKHKVPRLTAPIYVFLILCTLLGQRSPSIRRGARRETTGSELLKLLLDAAPRTVPYIPPGHIYPVTSASTARRSSSRQRDSSGPQKARTGKETAVSSSLLDLCRTAANQIVPPNPNEHWQSGTAFIVCAYIP